MREDWVECKFGDVLNIKNGKNQKLVENPEGIYPIYGSSGIIGWADEYLCDEETTIIGRKGTINTPIFVNTKFWNVDTAFGLTPYKILNSRLLFYFCKLFNFHVLDKSTTIPSLAKSDLLQIDFTLPPLPEQRAIVKKLESLFSSLDAGVADLKKAQQQLKIYRQAVLKKAFEGEWSQLKLEDVAKWGSGGTPSRRNSSFFIGSIPWVKTGELNSKFINDTEEKISEEAIKKSSAKLFPSGSVAIAMYGATIGKASIFGSEMSTNQACAVGQCYDNIFNEFLYYFLVSQKQQFIKLGIGGAQPNISQGTIKNYPIKLPSIAEQHQIVKQIESRLSVCDSIEQNIKESLEKAEALRQSILKKAFEGNLLTAQELAECKLADDYEPASVLLEKIKAEETEIKAKPSKKKPRHSVAKS